MNLKVDWNFLDTFNAVAFKGWSAGWLWIGTFLVWGIVATVSAYNGKATPNEWLYGWLAGLSAYSGISAFQYKSMRETDWRAMEIQHGAPVKEVSIAKAKTLKDN